MIGMDEETGEMIKSSGEMYLKPLLLVLISSLIALIFVVTTKDPGSGGPAMILFFLFWVFLTFLSAWALILQGGVQLLQFRQFSWVRLLYTSVSLAVGSVFLVGLQTLGQLQLIDVILVVIFELVLNFYLLRRF